MLKSYSIAVFLCFFLLKAMSQPAGFQKTYRPLHSPHLVADKNFYLLTVIDQTPVIKKLLSADPALQAFFKQRIDVLKSRVTDTTRWASSMVTDFRFPE